MKFGHNACARKRARPDADIQNSHHIYDSQMPCENLCVCVFVACSLRDRVGFDRLVVHGSKSNIYSAAQTQTRARTRRGHNIETSSWVWVQNCTGRDGRNSGTNNSRAEQRNSYNNKSYVLLVLCVCVCSCVSMRMFALSMPACERVKVCVVIHWNKFTKQLKLLKVRRTGALDDDNATDNDDDCAGRWATRGRAATTKFHLNDHLNCEQIHLGLGTPRGTKRRRQRYATIVYVYGIYAVHRIQCGIEAICPTTPLGAYALKHTDKQQHACTVITYIETRERTWTRTHQHSTCAVPSLHRGTPRVERSHIQNRSQRAILAYVSTFANTHTHEHTFRVFMLSFGLMRAAPGLSRIVVEIYVCVLAVCVDDEHRGFGRPTDRVLLEQCIDKYRHILSISGSIVQYTLT